MGHPEEIVTQRLSLRPLSAEMADDVVAGLDDFEVARWLARVPYPVVRADVEARIAQVAAERLPYWGIYHGARFCGVISNDTHLGYWLRRDAWGQGIMTEAARAVLAAHFSRPDAPPVGSGHFLGNAASAAILQKLGFSPSGAPHPVQSLSLPEPLLHQDMWLTPEQWHLLNPVQVVTMRLILRPLSRADAARVQQIGGNDDVAPMMATVKSPWPLNDVQDWIEQGRWRGRVGFRLGIALHDGTLVGVAGLGGDPANCAYMLDRAHWGQGLVTEAMRAFLGWAMDRFALDAVDADHFDDNPASGAVLRKLGFEKTGHGTGTSAARLEPASNTHYRLLKRNLRG